MASPYGIDAFLTTTDPFTVGFKREVEDFRVIEIGLGMVPASFPQECEMASNGIGVPRDYYNPVSNI